MSAGISAATLVRGTLVSGGSRPERLLSVLRCAERRPWRRRVCITCPSRSAAPRLTTRLGEITKLPKCGGLPKAGPGPLPFRDVCPFTPSTGGVCFSTSVARVGQRDAMEETRDFRAEPQRGKGQPHSRVLFRRPVRTAAGRGSRVSAPRSPADGLPAAQGGGRRWLREASEFGDSSFYSESNTL